MMNLSNLRSRLAQSMGVAAVAMLMLSATQRAEALSPIKPAASPIAQHAADALVTEVRGGGGHGGGGHGGGHGGGGHGGGGFHGGGLHGGGFHGGGFHRGGGAHGFGGYRHHFGRGFYGYEPGYYAPRRCRVIFTHYGPRRICRHHWHRHWRVY
jgi:hypothetical protein